MIRHMFSKKINLTPGVTVASLHRGVTRTAVAGREVVLALISTVVKAKHLVAVVVPDPVALVDLAHRLAITPEGHKAGEKIEPTDRTTLDVLIKDKRVYDEILRTMNVEAKKAHLKG